MNGKPQRSEKQIAAFKKMRAAFDEKRGAHYRYMRRGLHRFELYDDVMDSSLASRIAEAKEELHHIEEWATNKKGVVSIKKVNKALVELKKLEYALLVQQRLARMQARRT